MNETWKANLKVAGVAALGAFVSTILPLIGPFLTGQPMPDWRIKVAAAISGALTVGYSYVRPSPYQPK